MCLRAPVSLVGGIDVYFDASAYGTKQHQDQPNTLSPVHCHLGVCSHRASQGRCYALKFEFEEASGCKHLFRKSDRCV